MSTKDANEGQIQILAGLDDMDFAEAKSITTGDGDTLCNVELADDAEETYDLRNICSCKSWAGEIVCRPCFALTTVPTTRKR